MIPPNKNDWTALDGPIAEAAFEVHGSSMMQTKGTTIEDSRNYDGHGVPFEDRNRPQSKNISDDNSSRSRRQPPVSNLPRYETPPGDISNKRIDYNSA